MPTISRPSDTKFKVIIEGGPQLAAALNELDAKIKRQVAKDGLAAAGRVIADEWASFAPVGSPPEDNFPGAYQDSLRDPSRGDHARHRRTAPAAPSGPPSSACLKATSHGSTPRAWSSVMPTVTPNHRPGRPSSRHWTPPSRRFPTHWRQASDDLPRRTPRLAARHAQRARLRGAAAHPANDAGAGTALRVGPFRADALAIRARCSSGASSSTSTPTPTRRLTNSA